MEVTEIRKQIYEFIEMYVDTSEPKKLCSSIEDLVDELVESKVKKLNIPLVIERAFKSGDTVEIIGNSNAHEFMIGKKVVLDYFEESEWFTKGPECCWWLKEIDIKLVR
tara:strand:+ start:391 stop:717 length:327 start_codon:yes stop_codon:yes gene_type:complete